MTVEDPKQGQLPITVLSEGSTIVRDSTLLVSLSDDSRGRDTAANHGRGVDLTTKCFPWLRQISFERDMSEPREAFYRQINASAARSGRKEAAESAWHPRSWQTPDLYNPQARRGPFSPY